MRPGKVFPGPRPRFVSPNVFLSPDVGFSGARRNVDSLRAGRLKPQAELSGDAPRVALPPAPDSPHIPAMPAPRKSASAPKSSAPKSSAKSKASRPDLQPLDEHLAELLNPALAERRGGLGQGFSEAPQPKFETACARKPSARPDRRGGLGRFAQGAARRGRPEHPQSPAMGSAPAAAAGQVGGRAALSRRLRIRAAGRPAAGDRGIGQGRARHMSATRCCSASPARARPSPWPR